MPIPSASLEREHEGEYDRRDVACRVARPDTRHLLWNGRRPRERSLRLAHNVAPLPNGGVCIDYEATSREQGVQHRERSLLSVGPDDRDRLFVAHSEAPFVTEMIASEEGSGRFVQREMVGPFVMEIVIEQPEPDHLTYAWWWAASGGIPTEQSKADARRIST